MKKLTLTAPAAPPPPPPRVRKCPVCRGPFAPVDPDEQEAFALPPVVCACALPAHHAALAAAGFVPGTAVAVTVSRAARWPTRYGVQGIIVAKTEGPEGKACKAAQVDVRPFVSPFVVAALGVLATSAWGGIDPTPQQVAWLGSMLRPVTDPDMRAAMASAARIGGRGVVQGILFDPLREAAGEDPDAPEDREQVLMQGVKRLLRRGTR